MRGVNDFRLNEATMIEAVQEYLNKRMTVFAPKVTSVCMNNGDFRVLVTEPPVEVFSVPV